MKQQNRDLRRDVLDELDWDPEVDARKIGVTAEGGVVTLTGHVHTFAERAAAENIVKRVAGVQAVANDVEVELPNSDRRDDTDIAMSAVNALDWNSRVPRNKIQAAVRDGWITLDGEVEWRFQKLAAQDAVSTIRGVKGVRNQIVVRPALNALDVKEDIELAIRRNAELDAHAISVETDHGTVKIEGVVRSWAEHDDALNAAWAAPGVNRVVDHLVIRPA